FPSDQQNAFITLSNFGNVPLSHDGTRAVARKGFQDHTDVVISTVNAKYAGPSHTVERFEHNVAVLSQKVANQIFLPGHQCRGRKLRKLCYGELLVVIADRSRAVEDTRTQAFRQLQQVSAIDILHVEWRILAHQDDVEFLQR